MKRLLAILLLFGMLFAVMPAHAAETVIQDGVKVTLVTDKDRYEAGEWINAQLDIQNTNSYPIKNVRTSIVAPEGYLLLNGSSAEFAELSAGKSYVYKNSMVAAPEKPVVVPQTGDDSHIGLWLFLATLSFTVFCVLMSKNRKAGRMVSMLLCVVLVGTLLPSSVPVRADVFTKTIVVTKQVMVNGQTATVKGTVTYDCEAEPATFKAGDFVCTYDETGKGVTILEYTGEDKDIIVPAVINGLPVTGIAADAFDGHEDITLYVEDDSAAEKFAETMEIPYVVIGSATPTPTVTPTITPTVTPTATKSPTPVSYFVYEIVDGECIITGYCGPSSETYVVIPETIEGCPVVEIAKNAFKNQKNIETLELPARLEKIGDFAFSGCDKLTSITIPRSVTSIGKNPFICKNLKTISVEAGNTIYYSVDGMLVHQLTKTLVTYPCAFITSYSAYSGYTIPYGIKAVGPYAFDSCRLNTITIPGSVWKIEDYAFNNCRNLSAAYIPASVTSISYTAFGTASLGGSYIFIYGVAGSAAEKSAPYMLASVIFVAVGEDKFPVPAPTATPSPTPTPAPTPTATPEPEEDYATTAEMRYVNQFFGNLSDPTAPVWSEMGLKLCKWLDMDERSVYDRLNSGYLMLEEEYQYHQDTLFQGNFVWWSNKILESIGDVGGNLVLDLVNHTAMMTKFGTRGALAVPYYQQLADIYVAFLQDLEYEMSLMDVALDTVIDAMDAGQIIVVQAFPEAVALLKKTPAWDKLAVSQRYAIDAAAKKLTSDWPKLENEKYQKFIDEKGIDFQFAATAASWYEVFENYQNLSMQKQLYMAAFSSVTNDHMNALLALRNNLNTYGALSSDAKKDIDAAIGAMLCDIHKARNNQLDAATQANWDAALGSVEPLTNALFNTLDLFDIPINFIQEGLLKAVSLKSFDAVTAVAKAGSMIITFAVGKNMDFREATETIYDLKVAMTESVFRQLEDYNDSPTHEKAVAIIDILKLLKQTKISGEEEVSLHYLSSYVEELGLENSPFAMAVLWNELINCNSVGSYDFNGSQYTFVLENVYTNSVEAEARYLESADKTYIDYTVISTPIEFYSYNDTVGIRYQNRMLDSVPSIVLQEVETEWTPEITYLKEKASYDEDGIVFPNKIGEQKQTQPDGTISASRMEGLLMEAIAGNQTAITQLAQLNLHRETEYLYQRGSLEILMSESEYKKYLDAESKMEKIMNDYKNVSAIDYTKHQTEERLIWTRITNGYINSFPMFDPYDEYLN